MGRKICWCGLKVNMNRMSSFKRLEDLLGKMERGQNKSFLEKLYKDVRVDFPSDQQFT